MLHHDPIALWLAASIAGGLAVHAAIAAWYGRSYRRLRAAYANAIADVQLTGGDPGALVRAHELQRQFTRARPPSWIEGLGTHLRAAFVLTAIASLALAVATHRLPPVLVGVAILLAVGLRRLLLATVLLLAVFAASHFASLAKNARTDAPPPHAASALAGAPSSRSR